MRFELYNQNLRKETHLSIASCQIIPRSTDTVCSSVGATPVACFLMKRIILTRVTFSPEVPKSENLKKKKLLNKPQPQPSTILRIKILVFTATLT